MLVIALWVNMGKVEYTAQDGINHLALIILYICITKRMLKRSGCFFKRAEAVVPHAVLLDIFECLVRTTIGVENIFLHHYMPFVMLRSYFFDSDLGCL